MQREVPGSMVAKLANAAALIAEKGLDQTKIDELADITGIPRATLYYYFSGKEEILVFLLRNLLAHVAEVVAIGAESDGTAAERLAAVIRAQLQVMADQPAAWRVLIADLGQPSRAPDLAESFATAYYAPVEVLLTKGAADGSLQKVEDPAVTSMAIFGAATVAGLHHLLAGQPLDVDRLASQVTAFVLRGVEA